MNDDDQWKKALLNTANTKQKLAEQQEKERQDMANGVINKFPKEQSLSLQTLAIWPPVSTIDLSILLLS